MNVSAAAHQAPYATYLRVRDEVERMARSRSGSGEAAPSRYWSDELAAIDYIGEATPLVIAKLRHHAFHITGIRPYDYREYGDRQAWFERRLDALAALGGGKDLLVPEPEVLGGFGYRIDGRLYNVDTLKFFEVLVGMRRAGLIEMPGRTGARRLVWEIGGGWGGFAYQFKTLFPNTTYVIVDFPELFLFSATYLATVFPDATMRFWRDGEETFDGLDGVDFVFVPNDRADALRGARSDLLVNLVSFQEMTTAQVEGYATLAASTGCRSLYSLNRERTHYQSDIESVSAALAKHYDLREVRLLGSDYTKATKRDSALSLEEAAKAGRVDDTRYRHLAGTLRGRAAASVSHAAAAPRVGIGVTAHNRALFFAEALDSLLAQSYGHFTAVIVDDGSTDGTEALARAYARRDSRVRYVRFEQKQGMVAAWRTAFEEAVAGGAEYFAWWSDHDRWDPEWLATLVDTLDRHPDVALAYPLTQRMDPAGLPLAKPARQFETFGVADMTARWKMLSRSDSVAAGDLVYGLMRVEALQQAGIFREVLCPDRLLAAELTLRGQIRQVPQVLWHRRQFADGSIVRQRRTLFRPGAKVPSALTPPWYMHARSLWATYGRDAAARPGRSRAEIVRLIAYYASAYAWRHYGKSSVQRGVLSALGWPRWVYKRAKHAVLVSVHTTLVTSRRLGVHGGKSDRP